MLPQIRAKFLTFWIKRADDIAKLLLFRCATTAPHPPQIRDPQQRRDSNPRPPGYHQEKVSLTSCLLYVILYHNRPIVSRKIETGKINFCLSVRFLCLQNSNLIVGKHSIYSRCPSFYTGRYGICLYGIKSGFTPINPIFPPCLISSVMLYCKQKRLGIVLLCITL